VPAVGGDHVGVEITDHRRTARARPASQSPNARSRVLPARARRRCPGAIRWASPNRLRSAGAVGTGGGEGGEDGGRGDGPSAVDELGVDDLDLSITTGLSERCSSLNSERLFPKPRMSGHDKPRLGWLRAPKGRSGGDLLGFANGVFEPNPGRVPPLRTDIGWPVTDGRDCAMSSASAASRARGSRARLREPIALRSRSETWPSRTFRRGCARSSLSFKMVSHVPSPMYELRLSASSA
jgi:hypothetical protein